MRDEALVSEDQSLDVSGVDVVFLRNVSDALRAELLANARCTVYTPDKVSLFRPRAHSSVASLPGSILSSASGALRNRSFGVHVCRLPRPGRVVWGAVGDGPSRTDWILGRARSRSLCRGPPWLRPDSQEDRYAERRVPSAALFSRSLTFTLLWHQGLTPREAWARSLTLMSWRDSDPMRSIKVWKLRDVGCGCRSAPHLSCLAFSSSFSSFGCALRRYGAAKAAIHQLGVANGTVVPGHGTR
eukprot:scaffold495_cov243-Pinguiococcus_pyrenoidosus.AAC.18